MATMVLVPIKGFAAAKARLGDALDARAREELARALAATVLDAAAGLPIAVVCDDDDVESFALERGAAIVRQVRPGLNAAVAEGVEWAAGLGFERVLVVHADIPRATDLGRIALVGDEDGDEVVLVPDRHEDGTNVLVVPTRAGFVFRYGPGSFAAHRAEAQRLGLEVVVVQDEDLAWDVDTAADLVAGFPTDAG